MVFGRNAGASGRLRRMMVSGEAVPILGQTSSIRGLVAGPVRDGNPFAAGLRSDVPVEQQEQSDAVRWQTLQACRLAGLVLAATAACLLCWSRAAGEGASQWRPVTAVGLAEVSVQPQARIHPKAASNASTVAPIRATSLLPLNILKDKDEDKELDAKDGRHCALVAGVQVGEEEGKTVSVWKACAKRDDEDCSTSGCCADWGMKCFRRDKYWAACLPKCQEQDKKNNATWSCQEVPQPHPRTAEACNLECRSRSLCKQAIYRSDLGGVCHLSVDWSRQVMWADDNVNTSFCGSSTEVNQIQAWALGVVKQLPWTMHIDPLVNCSWSGENCQESKCCNDYVCDSEYSLCSGYSCYQKTADYASCAASKPKDWEGTWLGGPRDHPVVMTAGSTMAVHGRTLYCFSVVTWHAPRPDAASNSEAEIANHWQSAGLHILQCDGHDFFEGNQTPVEEWGAFSNIDMFMEVWEAVRERGTWRDYDWTVKVDADAVFLPSRLKDHLYKLRTPLGSQVYLENIDFKHRFLGALEVISRPALEVFFELGRKCKQGLHEGGEDIFMKYCLDGLGVGHQSDWELLFDGTAGMGPPCVNGWAVAYHSLRTRSSWASCYNQMICSEEAPTCKDAIPVPEHL